MPPETSDREISADLPGKERQGKKGKWSKKEGGKRGGEDFFIFFIYLFFFCFSLLKTTEICFGSTNMGIFWFSTRRKFQEK